MKARNKLAVACAAVGLGAPIGRRQTPPVRRTLTAPFLTPTVRCQGAGVILIPSPRIVTGEPSSPEEFGEARL
ncbi:MAG: hypothetical protein WBE26_11040 [Phycisphaerae bacterium]